MNLSFNWLHDYIDTDKIADVKKYCDRMTDTGSKVEGYEILGEDIQNVKSYIFMDVLVPAIKKAISDIVTDGISMILYGGTNRGKKGSSNASYVSYNSISDRRDERREPSTQRVGPRYDDITLESRAEAEEVLARMDELISMYGSASVADLYDLIGVTSNYTDNNYGWTNLAKAGTERTYGGGYRLKLPRAIQIK